MFSITRSLLVLATAGAASVPLAVRTPADRVAPTGDVDPQQFYTKNQAEYYLSKDQLKYIRPGLHIEVESIEIPADNRPVVELSFTDDFDQPLDRAGRVTPGAISASFILSWYDADLRDYVAYTTRIQTSPITGDSAVQASADSGGSWEDLELGRARYRFRTALPAGFDGSVTHSLGIYATRNLTATPLATNQYANVVYDWVPDGGEVEEEWQGMLDQTCNSCHEQLAFHGGSRRDVKLCVLCHNKQTIDPDTGNTVDMKVMIHKIHTGSQLPSVRSGIPYILIGFQQVVHDYSDVVFTQDVRNCVRCHTADTPGGSVWFTEPSRDSCGSCHDLINWEAAGEGHPIPQFNDDNCANCHAPEGEREFDISVMGAHTIPLKSSQLPGLNMEITEVTGAAPGGTPTVYFTLTNDDGSVVENIAGLRTLTLRAAGPQGDTIDHTIDISQDARQATPVGDEYMMTFTTPIPEDATGTWGFSADVRRQTVIDDGSEDGLEVTEGAFNPIYYAAVTDTEPVPRREVVSLDKCNVCHDVLSLHGGQRFAIQECVFCHRPNSSDVNRRPAASAPPESVDMRWMVHRIHTGAELEDDFTVYGFGGTPHNYNGVRYPGDLRTCEGCHINDSYNVPAPEGSQEVITLRSFYTPTQPAAAACLACHSTVDAAAHAYVNTAPFGESCAACHGPNRQFSVEAVHAH
jgi:OmcA/MtrC family decaheme c-type cytochrome